MSYKFQRRVLSILRSNEIDSDLVLYREGERFQEVIIRIRWEPSTRNYLTAETLRNLEELFDTKDIDILITGNTIETLRLKILAHSVNFNKPLRQAKTKDRFEMIDLD